MLLRYPFRVFTPAFEEELARQRQALVVPGAGCSQFDAARLAEKIVLRNALRVVHGCHPDFTKIGQEDRRVSSVEGFVERLASSEIVS